MKYIIYQHQRYRDLRHELRKPRRINGFDVLLFVAVMIVGYIIVSMWWPI